MSRCRYSSLAAAMRLASAISLLATAAFATVDDYGGVEACGGIPKFWDASILKAAVNEDVRHYELLTDEVIQNGIDWSKAREVAEGILVIYYKVEPETHPSSFRADKKQKFYLARVDLSQPGIRMTGPGRCNRWNEVMTDTTSTGYRCATLREKTTDLMARCRGDRADGGRAKDMRLAFNACAWGPWSDGTDQSSAYAQVNWPLMFDGVRVDRNVADGKWGTGSYNTGANNLFIFRKDGTAGFIRSLSESYAENVLVCIPNFGSILVTDGEVSASGGQADAQRTNIGLSRDGRYFYVSVSDGRKADTWASGPDYYECGVVQKAMGAWGAIALDGGGSSTLATWNPDTPSKIVVENNHGARRNGSNCGIYFYSVLKQDDSDYKDIDDYVGYGLAANDVATIVRDSVLTMTNGFPVSCTIKGQRPGVTLGWDRKFSPTVLAGTRVCFSNLTFAADSRTLTVRAGGTAAIASDVLDKVVTADAAGFELAGALASDLTVSCAGADGNGAVFGTVSVASPDVATLGHVRHPTDPVLCATVSGNQLVWKRYVTFSSVVALPGYDFTNALVKATVSDFAAIDGVDYSLRLTISDRYNHTAAVITKPLTGTGEYVFDTAEADSQEYFTGYGFDYLLELVDGNGDVVTDKVSVHGALNFANKDSWFSASAADDSETNGAWIEKPAIEGGAYLIGETDASTFQAVESRGGDVIIGTTATYQGAFAREDLDAKLADIAVAEHGALTVCEDAATGANVWCGVVKGADGQPAWTNLYGCEATPTVSYRIAQEIDFSKGKPYVSYLVAAAGNNEPVRLKDAAGVTWFDGIGSQAQAAGKLLYDGEIQVADIEAEHLDKSVAEADGVKYATFGEAAAAGGTVTLLTNASWTPDAIGDWLVANGGFDLRLYPSNLTAEYRDGHLVVTGGVVVPSRFPVNGSATVTAIVSDEFIQAHFPGKDVSKQADFDEVLAGLNAKRTTGNKLTLLESYILGLDPDDATAVPQATIAANAAGNGFVIALGDQVEVNEAADVGVKYSLLSAGDVTFTDSAETEPGADRTFTFEPEDETKQFFRVKIHFTEK